MVVLFGKIAAAIKMMVKMIPVTMRMVFNISQRK
jgi:hypothetical protein